jgi:hypothetical protein
MGNVSDRFDRRSLKHRELNVASVIDDVSLIIEKGLLKRASKVDGSFLDTSVGAQKGEMSSPRSIHLWDIPLTTT